MDRTLFEAFRYQGVDYRTVRSIWDTLWKCGEANTRYEADSLDICFGISIIKKGNSLKVFGQSEVIQDEREFFEFYEFSGKFLIDLQNVQELQTLIELLTNNAVLVTQEYEKSDWEEHGYHEPFTEK